MTNINGRRLRNDILDHIEAADIVFEVVAYLRRMLPSLSERVRAAWLASVSLDGFGGSQRIPSLNKISPGMIIIH